MHELPYESINVDFLTGEYQIVLCLVIPICNYVQVRNWLDEHYAHRWIGRGGAVFWPPRSPDLTPLDFYLWASLKNKVYSTEVISLEDLKQRITNSVTEMQHFQECRTVTNSVLRRCLACIDVQGQHFEMRH
ncbi:hypothetical protein X777_11231 [Ooceraea biroi]|uniref:Tc1-like transposase DDE domain-containing protein n=1 Tax=Ooceraea biroi TaxID=2015173 RepID=A0A026W2E4_OOCBI|nr:hypothetical protein X777_11231 [Ooceraea biroi]